jgi:type II secretory pathway pseudopilin PulG
MTSEAVHVKERPRESGFAMLLVFLMAAFIAISLYLQVPRISFQAQRQKEQLLIERGEQYKRAIQVFVRTNGRYPGKIEDLENFNNRRFLRHRFVDPMTGKTEWRLIHVNGGIFTDSIANKAKNGTQNSASVNNFVGEQAYVAPDTPTATPGAAGAGRRRQSEGGAVPLGPDGQPLYGTNGGQPPGGANGLAPFNGQFPGGDQQSNLNGQPPQGGGQPSPNQLQGVQQLIPGVPGAPGQPPSGNVPGFPPGIANNPGVPGQPDATGAPNFPGRFQPRQVLNQQGVAEPGFQPGGAQQPGFQQPGFQQPGVQPGGIQQPGFQQNGVPFGGQPPVNNQAGVGSSSFVGSSQSFVGNGQSFVGGGGFVGSQQNGVPPTPGNPNPVGFPNSFPNSQQNPAFGQQPPFGQQPGQTPFNGSPGDLSNQPNIPQGGATPYGQPNPGTSNAAANLINGILTNPRPGGQPGNPAPGVGQQLGGGIAGVASTAEADAIMVYNERSKYNEWEFIFDLSKQRGLINPNMPVPGQIASAPLAVGTGAPGVAVSGPAPTTAVPAGTQGPVQPTSGGGLNAGGAGPVIPGQNPSGQNPALPGMLQQGGLPPGFRLGRP